MVKMDREDAIEYLQDHGEITEDESTHPKFDEDEEKKIKKVMEHGKVYGDPMVLMD